MPDKVIEATLAENSKGLRAAEKIPEMWIGVFQGPDGKWYARVTPLWTEIDAHDWMTMNYAGWKQTRIIHVEGEQ